LEVNQSQADPSGIGGRRAGRSAAAVAARVSRVASQALWTTRQAWPGLSAYQRFEQVIALSLCVLVSVLVASALLQLSWRVLLLVLAGLADPVHAELFQSVLGMIMTVLIALEFNHSIVSVLDRRHGIVQLRTVVLIALLALVRKFIIIDAAETDPAVLLGLAASTLALGGVYWLVREQDFREDASERQAMSGAGGDAALQPRAVRASEDAARKSDAKSLPVGPGTPDPVAEASLESFPASDPPAWAGGTVRRAASGET
jgi:uncharacterized membrane protein (DUF373 family)